MLEELKNKIRPINIFDEMNAERFSHSKLETFSTCPYQYKLKYEDKLKDDSTTIALQLGSLCHSILEDKFYMVTEGVVDYNVLLDKFYTELEPIKNRYFEEWYIEDSEGHTYENKVKTFTDITLRNEMSDDEWKPFKAEYEFNFIYDDKYWIHGFIDRLDINENGEIRTIDYKTSKKRFDDKKVATSQQFSIYALAVLSEWDCLPIESVYKFIFLDDEQKALTKGWEKRAITKLDKLFNSIEECKNSNIWKPLPKPLCYWCYASKTNPNATTQKYQCDYHSLWSPNEKSFEVNKKWDETNFIQNKNRKLVF